MALEHSDIVGANALAFPRSWLRVPLAALDAPFPKGFAEGICGVKEANRPSFPKVRHPFPLAALSASVPQGCLGECMGANQVDM